MKTLKLISFIIVVIVFANKVYAQKNNLLKSNLQVKGTALLNDNPTSSYTVSVYLSGKKIDSMYCKSKRPTFFSLNYNNIYSICYQKENCKNKVIIVDTRIPKGLKELEDDTHDFEVEMSESLVKNSSETEDFPVAILLIDKREKMLVLCESYHQFMHSKNEFAFANEIK